MDCQVYALNICNSNCLFCQYVPWWSEINKKLKNSIDGHSVYRDKFIVCEAKLKRVHKYIFILTTWFVQSNKSILTFMML